MGSHVALLFHAGVELVCGFYGALYAGCVPLAVRPPTAETLAASLPTCRMLIELSKSAVILTTAPIIKLLKSKVYNVITKYARIRMWNCTALSL